MSFPFRHANGNICCSSPAGMCPTCAAKVAASRLAGEAVPPDILRHAKAAMAMHVNSGRVTEADMLALEAEVRAAAEHESASSVPDPYKAGLARERERVATPMSKFEDAYKAERLREIEKQHAEWAKR